MIVSQRPQEFTLDYQHWLWSGLLLGFFGRSPGSKIVLDQSQFKNGCNITNGGTISADWVYDSDLKRWGYSNVNAATPSYIYCGQPANINQATTLTACGWIRTVNVTTAACLLGAQSTTQGFSLNINQNTSGQQAGAVVIYANNGSFHGASYNAGITAGTLHHVGFCCTSGAAQLFLDGYQVASMATGLSSVGNNYLSLGANATTESSGANEKFFDWCIWAGSHPEKIKEMYNIGHADSMYGGAIIPISRSTSASAVAAATAAGGPFPYFDHSACEGGMGILG